MSRHLFIKYDYLPQANKEKYYKFIDKKLYRTRSNTGQATPTTHEWFRNIDEPVMIPRKPT